jgi:archaemetzincin
MNSISVIRLEASRAMSRPGTGPVRTDDLERLAAELGRIFGVHCHVEQEPIETEFAYDVTRGQYHSTSLLQRLAAGNAATGRHLLGVCGSDLFVPILTFVFGEAQLAGQCAIVSLYRLREEFYGLPARLELEKERLLKVAVHELGHTLGLRHCTDWQCVMASAHSVERVDLKSAEFCPRCRPRG